MPLPEKVIEQLGREPSSGTTGFAPGALLFSGGLLFFAIIIYCGLAFGYEPYLQSQLTATQNKVSALNQSISPTDQTQLINFYSQIANLQTLLQSHVLSSQLFSWLEQNTEANVYYRSFSLQSGNQVVLVGTAASEADVNQQIAIFENSPEVSSVDVTGVNAPELGQTGWSFNITLIVNPSVMSETSQ
ncbi:MAG TPA: PilN domain-containing protein [Candidatus Paceibacterota bacterium]|nr:PilN domain-containing protein [Candidatus Paceibacterota bacterium]